MTEAETEVDGEDIAPRVRKDWKRSTDHQSDWRTEARRSYDVVAGRQYTEAEEAALKAANRPPVVFNRVAPIINAISGYEINGRQEINFVPTEPSDNAKADVENAAAKWFRQQSQAEDEESQAFRDMLNCGYGWTNTRLDYEVDPEGMPVTERCDPLSMRYDPQAKRRNLNDARWVAHGKWMEIADAKQLIPDGDMLSGEGGDPADDGQSPGSDWEEAKYPAGKSSVSPMQHKGQVFVIEYQWWEAESVFRMANPMTGKVETIGRDIGEKLVAKFQEIGEPPPKMVPGRRRVYKRVFVCGNSASAPQPCPCPGKFTYQAMTGSYDRNKNVFYGIVRGMIDPQVWANKWLSQTMHNMNSAVKSGWFFEDGVFESQREAEQKIAQPGFMQSVAQGAISGNRMLRVDPQPIQPATMQLAEFAIQSIRDVPGVNVEMLGLADRAQAGVLESQRKAAGMSILAPMFDALRQYRKNVGYILLCYIRDYLSDGRLIRIVGDEGAKYVPLIRQPGVEKFDVVVDDAPTSPNMQEATWAPLMPMLPILAKAGASIPPDTWDYVPGIPSPLREKFKEAMKPKPDAPPPPEVLAAQQAQAELQFKQQEAQGKAQLEMAKLTASAQSEQARGQLELEKAQVDIELQREQMALEREKLQLERERMQLEREKIAAGVLADREAQAANQAFERERGDAENEMRRHAADVADFAQGRTANEVRGMMDGLAPALQAIGDGLAKLGDGQQAQAQATSALAQAVSAETELVRDPNTGRAIGARKKPPAMVM